MRAAAPGAIGSGSALADADAPTPARRPLERRLVVMMGARLGLSVLSLGLALALDAADGSVAVAGLYHTVAVAFLATAVCGVVLGRIRRIRPFAAVNIAMDIGIVTALVQFSGGTDSVFTFLYVIVAVYGAVLFDRTGAIAAACLGGAAYGTLLWAGSQGWLEPNPSGIPQAPSVLLTLWVVHAAAQVVAAALSSFLVTELARTDAALDRRTSDLQNLQSLHRRTVDSLMSGLLTTDASGQITSFNPEAMRITGLSQADAIGRRVDEVLPATGPLVDRCDDDAALVLPRMRTSYRNERGEQLHLGVGAYVLKDDGLPSGHVVIFQDVTEVVEMERDLRRSERLAAVGELSAHIAHEVRNPLAAISGSIQVLRARMAAAGGDGESRQLMDIVVRETDRLNQLVTDFLHYARPGPVKRETIGVLGAVEEVVKMSAATRPEAIRLELDVPPELTVSADAAQLRQVLWNLVLNACQAMSGGGVLRIAAAPASEPEPQDAPWERRSSDKSCWTEIAVEDTGAGIPADVRDQIFDPFFTTKREGSGLGLATVHRIVEGHGGQLRLETEEGRGTSVRLRLPREGEAG